MARPKKNKKVAVKVKDECPSCKGVSMTPHSRNSDGVLALTCPKCNCWMNAETVRETKEQRIARLKSELASLEA